MDILQQQDKEYIAGTYARFPLTIEGGKGSVVWDDAGKIYTCLLYTSPSPRDTR